MENNQLNQMNPDQECAGWILACRIIGASLVAIALSCAVGGIVQLGEPGEKTSAKIAFALSLLCSSASFGLFLLAYIISLLSGVRHCLEKIERSLPNAEHAGETPFMSKAPSRRPTSMLF